jgi:hypothetical protein
MLKLELEPKKGTKYSELCKIIKTISKKKYLLQTNNYSPKGYEI